MEEANRRMVIEIEEERNMDLTSKIKLAIIVGHNSVAKGMLTYNNVEEYSFNRGVALCLQKLGHNIYFRAPLASYEAQINGLASYLADDGITHAIELHLNSAATKAVGAEILCHYKENEEEKGRALAFLSNYCAVSGEKNRGQKNLYEQSRGFYLVSSCKSKGISAFILEPCFANWPNPGAKYVLENTANYIQTLDKLCKDYFSYTRK